MPSTCAAWQERTGYSMHWNTIIILQVEKTLKMKKRSRNGTAALAEKVVKQGIEM